MGIILGGIATGIMRPLLVFPLAFSVLPFCGFMYAVRGRAGWCVHCLSFVFVVIGTVCWSSQAHQFLSVAERVNICTLEF